MERHEPQNVWKQLYLEIFTFLKFPVPFLSFSYSVSRLSCLILHGEDWSARWELLQIPSTKSTNLHPCSLLSLLMLREQFPSSHQRPMLWAALHHLPRDLSPLLFLESFAPLSWIPSIRHHIFSISPMLKMFSLKPTILSSYLLSNLTLCQGKTSLKQYLFCWLHVLTNHIYSSIYFTRIVNNFQASKENGPLLVSIFCSLSPQKCTWLTTACLSHSLWYLLSHALRIYSAFWPCQSWDFLTVKRSLPAHWKPIMHLFSDAWPL